MRGKRTIFCSCPAAFHFDFHRTAAIMIIATSSESDRIASALTHENSGNSMRELRPAFSTVSITAASVITHHELGARSL